MVEDELHVGQFVHDPQRGGQLVGFDQQFVPETGFRDGVQPAPHVVAAQPVRVGLVLNEVPDRPQIVAADPGTQSRDGVGDRRRDVGVLR